MCLLYSIFFFFNDTATTEIYTLSLHDALPISRYFILFVAIVNGSSLMIWLCLSVLDRKSTRLNSSHVRISYAVFCLKKKTNAKNQSGRRPEYLCTGRCNCLLVLRYSLSTNTVT